MNRNHTIAHDHEHELNTGVIGRITQIVSNSNSSIFAPRPPLNTSQMLKVSIWILQDSTKHATEFITCDLLVRIYRREKWEVCEKVRNPRKFRTES
jgi:hypothetical protein